MRRLHVGGSERVDGWEVINALPGAHVDHVGTANDQARLADDTFAEVYASHVVEHFDYTGELQRTLREWHRVLVPGGLLLVSVPDLDILAQLLVQKDQHTVAERFLVMRMLFGGHINAYDYHQVGLNLEFLGSLLNEAGFAQIERVPYLGRFNDTSNLVFKGQPISLNVVARKPGMPNPATGP
jgi:predicted SAM-dependent methyltransferase